MRCCSQPPLSPPKQQEVNQHSPKPGHLHISIPSSAALRYANKAMYLFLAELEAAACLLWKVPSGEITRQVMFRWPATCRLLCPNMRKNEGERGRESKRKKSSCQGHDDGFSACMLEDLPRWLFQTLECLKCLVSLFSWHFLHAQRLVGCAALTAQQKGEGEEGNISSSHSLQQRDPREPAWMHGVRAGNWLSISHASYLPRYQCHAGLRQMLMVRRRVIA